STTGDAEVTTTVSSSAPTFRSALTLAVNCAVSSTASRFTVENPGRLNVTAYTPGRRSTILYCPCESVVTVRTRSISTGLPGWTTAPGSTAPVESRPTPAMPDVCANTDPGTTPSASVASPNATTSLRIRSPSWTVGRSLSTNRLRDERK